MSCGCDDVKTCGCGAFAELASTGQLVAIVGTSSLRLSEGKWKVRTLGNPVLLAAPGQVLRIDADGAIGYLVSERDIDIDIASGTISCLNRNGVPVTLFFTRLAK